MEKQNYVACLYSKVFLEYGAYIYKFESPLYGTCNSETDLFVDEVGREYPFLENIDMILDDSNPYAVGEVLLVDDAYDAYGVDQSEPISELLKAIYDEERKKFVLYSALDEETDLTMIKIDFDDFFEANKKLREKNNNTDKTAEYVIDDIDEQEDSKEEEFEELLEKLDSEKKYSEICISENGIIQGDTICNEIGKVLIGQNIAINQFVYGILKDKKDLNGIILSGSEGVGKSELIELTSKFLDRPLLIIDAKKLEHHEKTIEDYLYELYNTEEKDKKRVQNAMVIFENVEDTVTPEPLSDLYLLLDKKPFYLELKNKAEKIDTANMSVIVTGRFNNVFKGKKNPRVEFKEQAVMPEAILKKTPLIVRMKDLNKTNLKKILKQSKKSPIKLVKKKFDKKGVEIHFTEKALDKITTKASELKIGAKGLNKIVSDITKDHYKLLNNKNIKQITITDKTVDNPKEYKIKRR